MRHAAVRHSVQVCIFEGTTVTAQRERILSLVRFSGGVCALHLVCPCQIWMVDPDEQHVLWC